MFLGVDDKACTIEMAKYINSQCKNSRLFEGKGKGHCWFFENFENILNEIVKTAT